jgi:hypothetical protein
MRIDDKDVHGSIVIKAYICLPFSIEYRPLQRLEGFSCSFIIVIEAYSLILDIFFFQIRHVIHCSNLKRIKGIYNVVTDFVAR